MSKYEQWKGWMTEFGGLALTLALVGVGREVIVRTSTTGGDVPPDRAVTETRILAHLLDAMALAATTATDESAGQSTPMNAEPTDQHSEQSLVSAPSTEDLVRAEPQVAPSSDTEVDGGQGVAITSASAGRTVEGGREVRYYVKSVGPMIATGVYRRIGPNTYEWFDPATGRIQPTTQPPDRARHVLISYRNGRSFGLPFEEGIICLSPAASDHAEELVQRYPVIVVRATGLEGIADDQ